MTAADRPRPAPPVHRRKTDLVADYLREQIINGTIEPGRRLTLADLAAEFGMSQMPVREALLRLEREGLLLGEPHKGMRVPPVSRRDAQELFEVRAELEALAAYRAVQAGDPALAGDLEALNARFAAACAGGDYPGMGTANWAFHRRILAAAGSAQLARLLEDVWTRSFRYRLGYRLIPGRARHTVEEHAAIIAAAAAGDAAAARAAARAHIERAGAELDRVVDAQSDGG
ncbi:MAG: GntR family transcriptional regulator [Rhodobacteraceae bacterium]|nr:GntR family transcriptional regulator [Paracoccaceae bacterium]